MMQKRQAELLGAVYGGYVWRLNLYQSGLRKKYLQKTGTTD